jgi:hypothetical protein
LSLGALIPGRFLPSSCSSGTPESQIDGLSGGPSYQTLSDISIFFVDRYMPPYACLSVLSCNPLWHLFTLSIRSSIPSASLFCCLPFDSPLLRPSFPPPSPQTHLRPHQNLRLALHKTAGPAFHNIQHPITLSHPLLLHAQAVVEAHVCWQMLPHLVSAATRLRRDQA